MAALRLRDAVVRTMSPVRPEPCNLRRFAVEPLAMITCALFGLSTRTPPPGVQL